MVDGNFAVPVEIRLALLTFVPHCVVTAVVADAIVQTGVVVAAGRVAVTSTRWKFTQSDQNITPDITSDVTMPYSWRKGARQKQQS